MEIQSKLDQQKMQLQYQYDMKLKQIEIQGQQLREQEKKIEKTSV